MEKYILQLVDSIIINNADDPQYMTPNNLQLLQDFRNTIENMKINVVPTFEMMTTEQINSILSLGEKIETYKTNKHKQALVSPTNHQKRLDDISFDINYNKLFGSVDLLPVMQSIRKLDSQRQIFEQLIDSTSKIIVDLQTKENESISRVQEEARKFINRSEFYNLAEQLYNRTRLFNSLLEQ